MKTHVNTLIIACAFIAVALIASAAFRYKYKVVDQISVTGLAEKNFASDLIVWNGSYSRSSTDLKTAYAMLKQDENAIKEYLRGKGVADTNLIFSSVEINKDYTNRYDNNGRMLETTFSGYTLRQRIKIESKNIDNIEGISREITELIEQGIELNSLPPAYYYTKLSELKIDLLAQASLDAKLRAESIALNAGSSLGNLKKATMGVFQITGQNSNEDYSYGGAFNTTSRNKTASITLKTEYGVLN